MTRGTRIAGVPVLLAEPAAMAPDRLRPTVLWFHGFRADALAHAAELERCAAAGFLAVGVDAVGHGARRDDQLNARVTASPGGALPIVRELIEQTRAELSPLIDALVERHGADRTRVSAVGISMGAFLVYRAISTAPSGTPPFRCAVALLGSPLWDDPRDPCEHVESFGALPLLSVTAEHDVSVPPEPVTRLHARLQARNETRALPHSHAPAVDVAPQHHHVLRGAGHLTNADEWREAMTLTMQWLDRYGR